MARDTFDDMKEKPKSTHEMTPNHHKHGGIAMGNSNTFHHHPGGTVS